MKGGPRYKLALKRRRQGKTDYRLRYRLVISQKPRAVVRKTNKYILVQIVEFDAKGDKTIVAAHSKELSKLYNWKGYGKNTCAAYLTGYLAGLRAKQKGINEAILDIGLQTPSKGNRIFAALKGLVDAGIQIPHSEEILPDEERVKCEHISKWAEDLKKNNEDAYKRQFSKQLGRLPPEELSRHFEEVLNAIKSKEGGSK
ncbi:ribosomal protein L18 [Caldisphaera lagunensis DSM 15908]|uniref:Large ribosomal subunit protein uL18 n=1 Tax=Caldisphaera lagunensis (strain DSM 15908 / JCM 11604 / ANMR 0165 / IC-154) TaxID=1056495 RepID=L0ACW4_CALLD|nr:50S ribosomal protein L18 [Caldisphaera lagunensis]AFZ70895.1 ribosomal protein L18 [Caldisphaera lagunensis DSM 15908]